jgi:hypothetical protein
MNFFVTSLKKIFRLTALFTGIAVDHMDTSSSKFEREIAERKRAEEANVLARRQLQSMFDAATEISIIATEPSGITSSTSFTRMARRSPSSSAVRRSSTARRASSARSAR